MWVCIILFGGQFDKPIVWACMNFCLGGSTLHFSQLDVASCSSILDCSTQQQYGTIIVSFDTTTFVHQAIREVGRPCIMLFFGSLDTTKLWNNFCLIWFKHIMYLLSCLFGGLSQLLHETNCVGMHESCFCMV